jgi:hypothetical protein
VNPNPDPTTNNPPQLPETVAPSSLPQMNATAENSSKGTSKGVAKCKQKKHWFGLMLLLTDDKGKTTPLADVTIGLKLPDLGELEKVSVKEPTPVKVEQLEAGGTGEVLQLKHDTNVYEAVGDFS